MGKWPLVRLGDVGKIVTGSTPRTSDRSNYSSRDICFYKPGDFDEGKLNYLDGSIDMISENAREKVRMLPPNSVLVTCIGIIGKVGILAHEATCNQQINAIIPNFNVDSRALAYILLRNQAQLKEFANAPLVPIINKTTFASIKIPLPPLDIQKHIANTLDKTQEIIDGYKKQLVELDNLIMAVFYELFGDPLANDKGWTTVLLKEVLANIRYGTSTPPNFSETGYKFIRATNIKKGRIVEEDMKFISKEESLKLKKCKIYENEMIIVRSGVNSGDTCVISNEYSGHYAGYDLILTFDQNKVDPVFVNELFNTNYMEIVIKPLTRRAAQPHLNSEQVQSLRIILPPLDLQTKFANIVTKIEEQKALVKQAITESEHLFKSLMSEYFD